MKALDLARRGVVLLSLAWALGLAIIFALRFTFPLELEWMEDGALLQALRIRNGEPIYTTPSAEYVPYLYPPLYPTLLAGLGMVFPIGFVLGRVVSILAVVAAGFALWRLVGREGKPNSHRALAVGLFLSGYVFTFRWLDLARIDSTFLALTIWALVLLREGWGNRGKVFAAGVLMALAFWTKQTAFVFVLVSGLGGVLVAPRQLWIYVATIGGVAGAGVLLGNGLTDGWLWTYLYELHQSHAFNAERFRQKTWGMLAHAAPFLVVLALFVVGDFVRPWLLKRRRLDRRGDARLRTHLTTHKGLIYWGLVAAAALFVSAMGYSTQWAEPNAFIPGVCFGAAFVAVAMPVGGRREVVGLALVGAQLLFAMLVEPIYQPIQDHGLAGISESYSWQRLSRTVPSSQQRAKAEALRDELSASDGEVLALHRPWWSVMAGAPQHVGAMGLNDIAPERTKEIKGQLRANIREGRYASIWIEGEPPAWLRRELKTSYRVEQRRRGSDRVLPMSGYMSEAGMVTPYRRDQLHFVLPTLRAVPAGAVVIFDFEDGTRQGWVTEGRAFGHGPVRSVHRKLPPVGPIGGEYLLSSASASAGLVAIGEARSADFEVQPGAHLQMLLGATGPREHLSVELVGEGGARRLPIELGPGRWNLSAVELAVPSDWPPTLAHLHLVDEGEKSALFLDDVWLTSGGR